MELEYNQRLQITKLDNKFSKINPYLIDCGIVSWNSRDKIDSKLRINYIKPHIMSKLGIRLKNKIPMNKQLNYKYILNIDGHSRANRTSYLLQSGCVMFMVESRYVIGNICWYDTILTPYIHYIPVKYDFSNLEDQLLWATYNDSKCKKIVKNAKEIYYKYFSKEGIFDYCENLFNNIK